jgi:hypothetical protein
MRLQDKKIKLTVISTARENSASILGPWTGNGETEKGRRDYFWHNK